MKNPFHSQGKCILGCTWYMIANYCITKYTKDALGKEMLFVPNVSKTNLTNNQNSYLVMQLQEYFKKVFYTFWRYRC
jgi:hypothetical protein